MAIRKEQVLFLVTLAFAGWMVSGIQKVRPTAGKVKTTELSYESSVGREPILVAAGGPERIRERFVEPSESRPLPPRDDLPFPPLRPLPVVMLPLEMGQQPSAYHGLRAPAFDVAVVKKPGRGEGNAPGQETPGKNVPGPASSAAAQADPRDRYDALVLSENVSGTFRGLYLPSKAGGDDEKFRLGSRPGPYTGMKIRFQWINMKTGKTNKILEYDGNEVAELRLAKTLRNEVGMRLYKLKPSNSNIQKQKDLIRWLLQKGRVEAWVYDKALERAEAYLTFANPKEEGYLWKAKVLRAMGNLPGEFELFRSLDSVPELKGSSFQLRGLGVVEAKLGLDRLAEQHLKQAVAINKPIDPRNAAALAEFYLDRDRAPEAVPHAKQAVLYKTRRDTSDSEQVGLHSVLVRALLGVGDLRGAERAVAATAPAESQAEADYQAACVAYAKRDWAKAESGFQAVYNTGQLGDALLGLAAAQIGLGKYPEADANLRKLVDEQPRLRHLGWAGLALLHSGTGAESGQERANEAIGFIESGLTASPGHPYLLYLLGRQKRLNSDLEGAIEPLRRALRAHDDCMEALAELAVTHYALFQRNGDAQALLSALRYVDRLVTLDQESGAKSVAFLEMQGRFHYEARDWRGARAAFEAGAAANSLFCRIGLAMVDYTQKRSDLAEPRLNNLIRDTAKDDPFRVHSEHLLDLMIRHSNKEQVVDRFDRDQLGEAWELEKSSQVTPRIRDGVVSMKGVLKRPGRAAARRMMEGPGRFVEFQAQMKIGSASGVLDFVGMGIEIPAQGSGSTRFRLRVGTDDRGELIIDLKDGTKPLEPIRTKTRLSRDEWHDVLITVDDTDDADIKNPTRFLRVYVDGAQLVPEDRRRLRTLRRRGGDTQPFATEFRVEGKPGATVDVQFRNYRRVQNQKQ